MKVYRHPEGISLNGREYLLNEDDEPIEFESEQEICDYIGAESTDELEENGIYIER